MTKTPSTKANSSKKAEAQAVLIKRVGKHYPEILESMAEAAKGIYREEFVDIIDPVTGRKTGMKKIKIYQEEPDTRAAEYLINQIAGKPKESVEHTGQVSLTMDL